MKTAVFAFYLHSGGSEIKTLPDFEWSKRGRFTNGPDFHEYLKSESPTLWNQDKWPSFCQKTFEIWTEMSRFYPDPFEKWTIYYIVNYKDHWDPGCITCYTNVLNKQSVSCWRVNPHVREAHCGYTSFHKYVITIISHIWSVRLKGVVSLI